MLFLILSKWNEKSFQDSRPVVTWDTIVSNCRDLSSFNFRIITAQSVTNGYNTHWSLFMASPVHKLNSLATLSTQQLNLMACSCLSVLSDRTQKRKELGGFVVHPQISAHCFDVFSFPPGFCSTDVSLCLTTFNASALTCVLLLFLLCGDLFHSLQSSSWMCSEELSFHRARRRPGDSSQMHNVTVRESNVKRFCTEAVAARVELNYDTGSKFKKKKIINSLEIIVIFYEKLVLGSIRWLESVILTFSRFETVLKGNFESPANQPTPNFSLSINDWQT